MVNLIPTKEEWYEALSKRHGDKIQRRFAKATVAVCGLGGLGSNIAIALARAGVGNLILIDYDFVDITNIHRQQYKANQIGMAKTEALKQNLSEIAPYIAVEIYPVQIDKGNAEKVLQKADIVCEAFDDPECKAMLAECVLEKMPDKYLIAASGMAGMESANTIKTRRVSKRFYICGDETNDVQSAGSLISSRVMLCAAHQAHTVLRILAEKYDT